MKRMSLSLVLFALAMCCATTVAPAASLTVALYPYVPRYKQFTTIIEQKWRAVEPTVPIVWVPKSAWDGGYDIDPPSSFDVYVFDAINLDYFRSQQWLLGLQPSEVDNIEDFLSYAAQGVQADGLIYAIPQLGCGSILFYEKSDSALAQAKTVSDVTSALTSCAYYASVAPSKTGLMMDLSGGTTNASTYVEGVYEQLNQFPVPLPQNPSQVDQNSIAAVRKVLATASFQNAYYSGADDYQRAAWFNAGNGRAYIGFTESMSRLSPQRLAQMAFKPMPWSDNPQGSNAPLFYSDVIGVHPATRERGTRTLAVKLANLMASTDVIVASFGAFDGQGPQYLMAVRHSAFKVLGASDPVYQAMYAMVNGVSPILFNLGPDSKPWLQSMKAHIATLIKSRPTCYTDIDAGPIVNDTAAQTTCPQMCSTHGGWSGQWTTPVSGGTSVCGCNTPRQP